MDSTAPSITEQIALRRSIGTRISSHALVRAALRGFSRRDILLAVADPDSMYTQWNYGAPREMRRRGDIAVVFDTRDEIVVTVLWRHEVPWTDDEVFNRALSA